MKKYVKPNLNIEELEIKEVIAALSNATTNGFNAEGNEAYTWEEFWN